MKPTSPALAIGVGFTAFEVTAAAMAVGAVDRDLAIANSLKELPDELCTRLSSKDPTVRVEALVDTLTIAGASTAIAGRLQQAGSKAISTALEQ